MSSRGGSSRAAVRLFGAGRTAWGLTVLCAPDRVLVAVAGRVPSYDSVQVARVLGAREIAQGAVTALAPSRRVLVWGAVVDALHATSMAGLAAVSPRHRRPALASAGLAAAAALAGRRLGGRS